jgi:methionyl-tRNA synthetase
VGRTFYITTPIYYVNDLPHIGHMYTTVVADCIARFKRMRGFSVFFLTGTDEHGQKIEKAAKAQGIEPLALADQVVARYHELWRKLEITHDDFLRTTQERHKAGVRELIRRMTQAGDIYKASYEGWYCAGCEVHFPGFAALGHSLAWRSAARGVRLGGRAYQLHFRAGFRQR